MVNIDNIIAAITPLIIYGVTFLVQKIKPTLVGWNIVWVVVPILNLIATTILVFIDQTTSFWGQFAWNFLAVVIAQLITQLSSEKRAETKEKKEALKKDV